jgi:hypothetical protein
MQHGITLAPARLHVRLVVAPPIADMRRTEAIINTSEGPYRIPLRRGRRARDRIAAADATFEGAWWHAPAGSESGWGSRSRTRRRDLRRAGTRTTTSGEGMVADDDGGKEQRQHYDGTLTARLGRRSTRLPFDPNQVQRIEVGSGTLSFTSADDGTFDYTVNGVTQSKAITRFALAHANLHVCDRGRSRVRHQLSRAIGGLREAGNRGGASTSRTRATRSSRAGSPTISTARPCGCRQRDQDRETAITEES